MSAGNPLASVARRPRGTVLAAVLAVVGGLLTAPAANATPAAPSALGEEAARAAAVATRQRVEATALRTENIQVFANPNGTFTMRQSVVPERVRRGADWVPVDTTLYARADGTVAPAATTLDMAFSGGGSGPLVRLRRDGAELALAWPGRLPTPVLAGNTATYREVLPGVDLLLRAEVESLSQLLVVKSAQAATNPALHRLRFPVTRSGLSLRTGAGGGLAAVDAAGREVFRAPAAYMWDSSGEATVAAAAGQARSSAAEVPGGRVRSMAVSLTADAFTLAPDRALLTAPGTHYPVYLDPSWSGNRTNWTQVWSNYPNTSFYNGANLGTSENVARVGYDATDGKLTRSLFQIDTSGVRGKHVLKATLQTYETWSRSCTTREVQAWEVGSFGSSTTWSKQPSWIAKLDAKSVAKGYSSSCPAGGVEFNVTAHVQKAANNNWTSIHEGLRASATAESNKDTLSWKKFRNNPTFTIEYNTVPAAPTNLTTDNSTLCTTGSGRLVLGTATPTLRATVSDPDNSVKARFEWWTQSGTAPVGSWTSATVAGKTPTVVATTVPSGAFSNGSIAKWRVRAEDGTDTSAWSGFCEFQVDTSRPPIPTLTSNGFPDNGESNAVMGTGLRVTLGPNGGTDVSYYEYAVNGDVTALTKKATPSGSTSPVDVTVVPDRFVNWMHARAVDKAGNRSEVATVIFYAAEPSGPVADWPLDYTGDGTVAEDVSGGAHHATLAGGAAWTEGVTGGALNLDGTTGYASTADLVPNATKSFSVSAWVRLDRTTKNGAAMSQPGNRGSAFLLYYSATYQRWEFKRMSADADSPVTTQAVSTTKPVAGEWYHLIGVYDAPAQQLRLYVNGLLEGTASYTTPWSSSGPVQLGRSKWNGNFTDYWPGDLDAERFYDRVLLPGEIQQVPRLVGRWKLDETSGTTAADSVGGHPATWSTTGVTRIAGVNGNAVQLADGVLSTTAPAIRTDGSYTVTAWVRPDALTKNGIALSQDGGNVGGVNLGWSWDAMAGVYRWSIRTPVGDSATAEICEAVDEFGMPIVGTWTFLAGVYDAQAHALRLYVDGQFVAESYFAGTWQAAGAVRIGRGRAGVTFQQYLTGAVDDARTYAGPLSDQAIWDLYTAQAG
ncbi:LamG-like jellyroll fold domain-containing protein [Micromonospora eburnea]|uniref:LamG-like jellyroll fold domain-containing protein n=1 Tax=Micromonospora eburnea TaxID=227316 RepID=UPI0036413BA7